MTGVDGQGVKIGKMCSVHVQEGAKMVPSVQSYPVVVSVDYTYASCLGPWGQCHKSFGPPKYFKIFIFQNI